MEHIRVVLVLAWGLLIVNAESPIARVDAGITLAEVSGCEASSTYDGDFQCDLAYDGLISKPGEHLESAWASRGEGTGAWILINLSQNSTLRCARLAQRKGRGERFKDIRLDFSHGSSQTFHLPFHDCYCYEWDVLPLDPVTTDSVRITALSHYKKINNGWAEIELHIGDCETLPEVMKEVTLASTASCEASSTFDADFRCDLAIDRLIGKPGQHFESAWASRNEGTGAWILINLSQSSTLRCARLAQRKARGERFKDIRMDFSDGSSQTFLLPFHDCYCYEWDVLPLDPVTTDNVRITALSHYSQQNNGWAEIELHIDDCGTLPEVIKEATLASTSSCEASSTFDAHFQCDLALDGLIGKPGPHFESAWASRGEGTGAWILINLAQTSTIRCARLAQRKGRGERFKDIKMDFSDGSSQTFHLPFHDCYCYEWDVLPLDPITTSSVRITALSHHTQENNGWAEIELHMAGCDILPEATTESAPK